MNDRFIVNRGELEVTPPDQEGRWKRIAEKAQHRALRAEAERDSLARRVAALRAALMDYASLDPGDEPWTVPLWAPARTALAADDEAAR